MDSTWRSDVERILLGEKPGMIDFGRDWPEAKWRVFENIWVYLGLLGFNVLFDPLVNLSRAFSGSGNGEGHPYSIGVIQALFFAFCAVQLMRTFNQWKYYGRFPWEK